MTSSNGNTFCVTGHLCGKSPGTPGEFPTQRPVTRSFDAFFDLRLNKRLSKQWWGGWFETLSRPLLRHRNDHKIAPLPVNQPWKVRLMASHKFTNNSQHSHTMATQSKTEPCIYVRDILHMDNTITCPSENLRRKTSQKDQIYTLLKKRGSAAVGVTK